MNEQTNQTKQIAGQTKRTNQIAEFTDAIAVERERFTHVAVVTLAQRIRKLYPETTAREAFREAWAIARAEGGKLKVCRFTKLGAAEPETRVVSFHVGDHYVPKGGRSTDLVKWVDLARVSRKARAGCIRSCHAHQIEEIGGDLTSLEDLRGLVEAAGGTWDREADTE